MNQKSKTHVPSVPQGSAASDLQHSWRKEIICWAALAGGFALFASLSWRTWPDVLVDFGHELYIPWRLCEGEVLYRDMAFTMGPLSQYFNALLFKLFGVSLSTLIWANLTILAAIVGMLYWLFRQCGSCWSATFVLFFFLAVFAFAQFSQIGNYNYVCPYRHEVTHGLALGLAQLICLIHVTGWVAPAVATTEALHPAHSSETPPPRANAQVEHAGHGGHSPRYELRWLAGAGACLGLIFLTKVEMFLPAAVVTAATVVTMARSGGKTGRVDAAHSMRGSEVHFGLRRAGRAAGIIAASAAMPIAAAFVALAIPLGLAGAVQGTLGSWAYAVNPALTAQSGFYRALGGWDRPVENLEQMVLSAVCVVAAFVAGVLLETMLRGFRISRRWTTMLTGAVGCVGILFLSSSLLSLIATGLPLILGSVLVVTLPRVWRSHESLRESRLLFLISLFALVLLSKILLAVNWGHYGFVLAMPGILVTVHVVVHTVPQWLQRSGYSGAYFRAVAVGLLGSCAFTQALTWLRIDGHKTLPFGSGGDLIYVDPRYDDRAAPTVQTLAYLQQAMRPNETLVVIPEGTTLNYLLRKRNPTGYLMFSPWEFDAHGGEERFLQALVKSPPDYVVLVTMDMRIHGRGNFGAPHYGQQIRAFIDQHYQLVDGHASVDATGQPTFQTAVFRRAKAS